MSHSRALLIIPKIDGYKAITKKCVGYRATRRFYATRWFLTGTVEHYFWALMFMKVYGKMHVMCTLAGGCDPKTFRKWSWIFIEAIASCEYLVVSAFMSQTVNCCFIN